MISKPSGPKSVASSNYGGSENDHNRNKKVNIENVNSQPQVKRRMSANSFVEKRNEKDAEHNDGENV